MKVVIGGANGLIGKRLTRALVARGDAVVQLVRSGRGSEGGRGVAWDGRSQGAWSRELDGADAVVNLAGANVAHGRWTDARKREITASRIDSTRALVAAMRAAAARPRTFLCASAVGYYGPRGDEPIDEGSGPGRDFLAEVCAAWEAEARTAESLSVRTLQMRTGIVLAKSGEGSALDSLALPFKLFAGGKVGDGQQWFPWIHVEDEVAAFLWALDRSTLSGPLNLAAPGIVNGGELARALGRALQRPSWLPVPAPLLRLAVGEFSQALTTGQRAVPARLLESGFKFRFPELDAALRDLLA